ncbi:MAG: heavy metal-binding domain-containing protein [Thermoanaerobaculia bacterium]
MKRTLKLTTLILTVMTAMAAFAHGGNEDIMGTVTRAEKGQIEVKSADGKVVAVAVTSATIYKKEKGSATLADVKPGVRVAIEAMKGKAGLEAMEVRIGAMEAMYTCPMHPEIQQHEPGKCPKCGMNLEKKKG